MRGLVEDAIIRIGGSLKDGPEVGTPGEKWIEHILHSTWRSLRHVGVIDSALTNSTSMMHSIDRENRLISVTNAWCNLLGYSPEEAVGQQSIDFLTDDSRRKAIEQYLPLFWELGGVLSVPYEMVSKKGYVIPIQLSAVGEFDANGIVSRSLAIIRKV